MEEVLIVGAGPTGLMLAILLNRIGVPFRIIDQNPGPVKESRALGIQARSLELFHKLGLIDKFLERGMKVKGAILTFNGKERLRMNVSDMSRPDTLFPYIFLLSQSETEKILLEELTNKGVKVERNIKLVSFVDNKHHIDVVTEKNGKREHSRTHYLCGCDGSHSVVRKQLKLQFKGGSYPSEFVMADAKVDWNRPYDKVQVFLERGKVAVFFPLKNTDLSRVICVSQLEKDDEPDTEATTVFKATLDEVEKGFRSASHVDLRLTRPEWVTRYHVHHRSVDRMRVGNVFLLGDSAHIHSPVGAQGMNTGLQDADNLAWKLRLAIKNPEIANSLLETYQLERHPVAEKLMKFTDRFFYGVIVQNKALLKLRDFIVPPVTKLLMNFPQGKRMLFKFVSQLNIHYHKNYVVKIEVGERAPNGRIDEDQTLHDLMNEYEFHVLAFKKMGFTHPEVTKIYTEAESYNISSVHFFRMTHEHDGYSLHLGKQVFDFYGVETEGIFLVRPDGYIGFKADNVSAEIDFPHLEGRVVHTDLWPLSVN